MRTVTPPWAAAPSRTVYGPLINPAPTSGDGVLNVMPGAVTVTFTAAAAWNPGAVALIAVVPAPIGSKPMGADSDWPALTSTVCVWPDPLAVTSCATAVFVCVTVIDTGAAPARSGCVAEKAPAPLNTPIRTRNDEFGESVVVLPGFVSCNPTAPTVGVLCPWLKPAAVAVNVTAPLAPSTP